MCHAQNSSPTATVTTVSGAFYSGQVKEDVKDGHITIVTKDSSVHQISYNIIRSIQYDGGAKYRHSVVRRTVPDTSTTSKARAAIPRSLLRPRNAGIGVSIAGVVVALAGVIMIAKTPTITGSVITNSTVAPIVVSKNPNITTSGIVVSINGVAALIGGLAGLAHAQKRINRYKSSH